MMYRCGWSEKDEGQRRVLAIDISREGFESALRQAVLSDDPEGLGRKPPVRVQWDSERDLHLHRLPYRSIQIGLSGPAAEAYVNDWTLRITDVTQACQRIKALVDARYEDDARDELPEEQPYPLPPDIEARLC